MIVQAVVKGRVAALLAFALTFQGRLDRRDGFCRNGPASQSTWRNLYCLLATGALLTTDWLLLALLKIPRTSASNDDGVRHGLGKRDLGTSGECSNQIDPDNKVLLQLSSTTIVRRRYPKL